MKGADFGYSYMGDEATHLVTMLKRDTRGKTATVKVERATVYLTVPLTPDEVRSLEAQGLIIPRGVTITVPLRRVVVNDGRTHI